MCRWTKKEPLTSSTCDFWVTSFVVNAFRDCRLLISNDSDHGGRKKVEGCDVATPTHDGRRSNIPSMIIQPNT